MSSEVKKLMGKQVSVLISGNHTYNGVLRDVGQDILVLYNGIQFLYIPLIHVHRIQQNINTEDHVNLPTEVAYEEELESITFSNVLTNAKGIFTEISVIRNLSFHGSIIDVLGNYLVFNSPIYNMMLIHLDHLKWLIPYQQNNSPYTVSKESRAVSPSNDPFLPSLEEQLKKEVGKLVVLDGGVDPLKIGLLKKLENNLLELVIANGETVYLQLNHIKSAHLPYK